MMGAADHAGIAIEAFAPERVVGDDGRAQKSAAKRKS
jgi:hypothetical protein